LQSRLREGEYPNGSDDGELDFLVGLVEADGAESHGRHGHAVVKLQHLRHFESLYHSP
jgi:hypothetical protein